MRMIKRFILIALMISLSACAVIVDKTYDKNKVILPPSSATISSLLSKADQYQASGQSQQALVTLERAIQIEPVDPVPWYRAAQTYWSLGDYNQAIAFAQRAVSLSSSHPSLRRGCWRLIANSHQALGQLQQAKLANQRAEAI